MQSSVTFREWLADAMSDGDVKKRALARRMAEQHPRGVSQETIETGRRTIRRILKGDLSPRDPLRDSIAAALGRDDHPSVQDEEEDDLEATLYALTREQPQLARALIRLVRG